MKSYSWICVQLCISDISTEPGSLLFGKIVCVSFDEFLTFVFVNFPLEVFYHFFIADPLHRLQIRTISLVQESLDFFDKSFVKHFVDSFVNSFVGFLLSSSQSNHKDRPLGRMCGETFRLRFSRCIIYFQRSDDISQGVHMMLVCLCWIYAKQFIPEISWPSFFFGIQFFS